MSEKCRCLAGLVSIVAEWAVPPIAIGGLIGIIILPIVLMIHIPNSNSAAIESKIFNERFGTSYTTHEFYWSGREIKRLHAQEIPKRPQENIIKAELTFKK